MGHGATMKPTSVYATMTAHCVLAFALERSTVFFRRGKLEGTEAVIMHGFHAEEFPWLKCKPLTSPGGNPRP